MSQRKEQLIKWLEENPELLGELERIKELEDQGADFHEVEGELMKLTRELGAGSLERWTKQKQKLVSQKRLPKGTRKHSKKNE